MPHATQETARILIVDDDMGVRETFMALLEPPHWVIDAADSAQVALEHIRHHVPDVILLDIMMPVMDGLTLCRILKGEPDTSHIPIILVTALSDKKSVARGLDAGADDFLSKPISGIELQARVRSMLRIKRNHDRLEEARRLRKELSDLIVHDLRTPISVVAGCAELLETHVADDAHAHTLLERIRTQTSRMEKFLTDLLLTAKIEAGQLRLSCANADVSALVTRASDAFFPIAQHRSLSLQVLLPPAPLHWDLDENLVIRVLDNLLMNAVKHTPLGGRIEILVEASNGSNGPHLKISVSDTGPGIPAELRDRIFEPFSIIEARRSGSVPIGLGLAFCNLVATCHGGQIVVSDNAPQGSIFSLVIPGSTKEGR